mmetsp:Transcript_33706/g.42455  ORF Transcript_33706/g.42455 Transcript_33706/m.42455 type:complete len:94 (+) Transcript_33706:257-538(+)
MTNIPIRSVSVFQLQRIFLFCYQYENCIKLHKYEFIKDILLRVHLKKKQSKKSEWNPISEIKTLQVQNIVQREKIAQWKLDVHQDHKYGLYFG